MRQLLLSRVRGISERARSFHAHGAVSPQIDLFSSSGMPSSTLPEGFPYQRNVISGKDEDKLLGTDPAAGFASSSFGGEEAHRLVFEWKYRLRKRKSAEG